MNECENKCVNEHRFKQIEEDLKQLRERNSTDHKEFYNRIEDVEKRYGRVSGRQKTYQ